MALLALTWGMGYVNQGYFNLMLALAISVAKMLLIVLFFMHLSTESRVLHLAAVVGPFWLFFMLALNLGDYVSRGWVSLPLH